MELRIAYVPGVTLGKWSRVWEERFPDVPLVLTQVEGPQELDALLTRGEADMVFARLPFATDDRHSIALYDEQPFVVLPREHPLADDKVVALADLEAMVSAGDIRFDLDPTLTLEQAVDVIATGTGVAVMPQSLARLYGRKGVVSRQVDGLPTTAIALVWPVAAVAAPGAADPATAGASPTVRAARLALLDDFIGVVRGRSANSSRGAAAEPAAKPARKAPAPAAKRGGAARPRRAQPRRPRRR